MPCTPLLNSEGKRVGVFCTANEYEFVHEGRTWRFEWHDYCGPWPLTTRGKPWKRAPGEKSKFWDALKAWEESGEKIGI